MSDLLFIDTEHYSLCDAGFEMKRESLLLKQICYLRKSEGARHGLVNNVYFRKLNYQDTIRRFCKGFAPVLSECVVVAHHAKFDMARLRDVYEMAGLEMPVPQGVFCTMVASRDYFKLLPMVAGRYKYPSLEEMYGILFKRPVVGHHNAQNDVIALERCFRELKKRGVFSVSL